MILAEIPLSDQQSWKGTLLCLIPAVVLLIMAWMRDKGS